MSVEVLFRRATVYDGSGNPDDAQTSRWPAGGSFQSARAHGVARLVSGLFSPAPVSLDPPLAEQPLGDVLDERGHLLERLCAPFDGVVVMARRTARVRPGDGAYMVALPEQLEDPIG